MANSHIDASILPVQEEILIDLADVDFAYSPPIGTANDAINMAAYTAENRLSGFSPSVTVSELDDFAAGKNPVFVDVRDIFAYEKSHIEGAIDQTIRGPSPSPRSPMSTVSSIAPVATLAAAPFLGGAGAAATVALANAATANIAGTQADVNTAVQLAQATPQQLARMAADGDDRAQHILDQAKASRRLLSPVDFTA